MPAAFTRILSDIHFGDRASNVKRLEQLRPLLAGVDHLVLNGDTLDTRPGPDPEHTRECSATVRAFFFREIPTVTYLTGNHDADFSPQHYLDVANGTVFVIHGDILFDDIVPWSGDASFVRRRMAEEFRTLPVELHHDLDHRLALFRRVAAAIPQRHQSEKHGLKYTLRYLADTVWPPARALRIVNAWQNTPRLAVSFAERHRPGAKFIVTGHTHCPGVWPNARGVTVINTGSYALALGGTSVDVFADRLTVRRVQFRRGEFHPGAAIAEFPLARP